MSSALLHNGPHRVGALPNSNDYQWVRASETPSWGRWKQLGVELAMLKMAESL